MNFTQKETAFLNDLIAHEKLCIEKYNKYTFDACDGQLKNLFTELEKKENQHLETLTQIMGGTVPQMKSGGKKQPQTSFTATYTADCNSTEMQKDKYLCDDALSMEKYVSATYNTGIFEFRDTDIRNALNHIQKEEQEHGEQIYSYMSANGMYNA